MSTPVDKNGWSRADYAALLDASEEAKFIPEHWLLMACNESGLKPTAFNPSGARGLWQAMPSTLRALGWKAGDKDFDAAQGEFRNCDIPTQIRWSIKYFNEWRNRYKFKSWDRVGDLYLCIFAPAHLPWKDQPAHVIFSDGKAYEQNKGVDWNKKGHISVADIDRAAKKHAGSARYLTAIESLAFVREERIAQASGIDICVA